MVLRLPLTSLLIFLRMYGICKGFEQENCTNHKLRFETVYSVPGEVAMLTSTLVSPSVSNFTDVPYNITWYDSKGKEIINQTGRVLVLEETLWFLNTTLDDNKEYMTILRTPSGCHKQRLNLTVEQPEAGKCERPRKTHQFLTKDVSGMLSCPLRNYTNKLKSYNITFSIKWYRGCERIEDGTGGYSFLDDTKIMIHKAGPEKNIFYTCTLTFTLAGITGSVSETINATVKEEYYSVPQLQEPANETIRAQIGFNFSKRCLAFVPSVEIPSVSIVWKVRETFIERNQLKRVYTGNKSWRQDGPNKGYFFERVLMFSEVKEEDFHINYICEVISPSGSRQGYFTLLPEDPNIILPIGLVLSGVIVLFISSVTVYYLLKVDIVLWFRRVFPFLYQNKDLDGKLYDAYVAHPQPCDAGFGKEVEKFALHTLPEVLENTCGYQLFIAGRDCLPGQAIVDSVEENLQASRRVLLLYTASTFISKRHTSNNQISKSSDIREKSEIKTTDNIINMTNHGDKEVSSDTRQQIECVAAMHRALLEGSLKVVLVELEEITPAQLALFPESVRQLRKKQGAVRWWKNLERRQRSVTCNMRRKEDEEKDGQETPLSPSLSPSSRFWKEMRYHMPVRGKKRCVRQMDKSVAVKMSITVDKP
ncbi:interleukin-1 receptor-like 2 [Labrus mixtus]|uniref:interleukin-1 receptor-like 2 n=1 Tax=Labrus mixtus TaxID=508554 RepID=UPI0029C0659E|nr:interleukin-1 receptor-like 2 [Labrus mixtus]